MAVLMTCGLEDATIGTHWNSITGSPALDSSVTGRNGAKAARIDIVSSVMSELGNTLGSHTAYAVTLRFRVTALPSVDVALIKMGGYSYYDLYFNLTTAGKIEMAAGAANSVSTATIAANTWYILSWKIDGTARTAAWSIDGSAQPAVTCQANDEAWGSLRIGNYSSAACGTFSLYIDDVKITDTYSDFPFAAGHVDTSDAWVADAVLPTWTTPADTVSMSSTPDLQFNSPTSASAQHFYLQLDTANTFNTGNLREYDSSVSQTNWTYWNGSTWTALPGTGLPSGSSGNEVRYSVTSALSAATWYRRVRAGTGT
jgi:hypothetical protein